MTAHLQIYIGTSGETFTDFLCMDLRTPNNEYTLKVSPDGLDTASEQDFIDAMTSLLVEASSLARHLNIPIKFDRAGIKEIMEDFSPEKRRELIKLLKGVE